MEYSSEKYCQCRLRQHGFIVSCPPGDHVPSMGNGLGESFLTTKYPSMAALVVMKWEESGTYSQKT